MTQTGKRFSGGLFVWAIRFRSIEGHKRRFVLAPSHDNAQSPYDTESFPEVHIEFGVAEARGITEFGIGGNFALSKPQDRRAPGIDRGIVAFVCFRHCRVAVEFRHDSQAKMIGRN